LCCDLFDNFSFDLWNAFCWHRLTHNTNQK
jgi:hypothetical protein